MSTRLFLTDEDATITGYKKLLIEQKADCCSLVITKTATVTNPATQPQVTRQTNGNQNTLYSTNLQFITEPLAANTLSSAAWIFHIYASVSNILANTGLKFILSRFTNAIQANFLTSTTGSALTTLTQDYALTSVNATGFSFNDGDRLVLQIYLNSVGGSVSGYTVNLDYNGLYPYADGDSYIICPDDISILAVTPVKTITRIRNLLKDNDIANPFISDDEIIDSIDDALKEYNQVRPLKQVAYLSGDGVSWDYPLPRGFIPNFTVVSELEFPSSIFEGDQVKRLIDDRFYEILQEPSGIQPIWFIRFNTLTPDSGVNNVAIRYTTRNRHDTVLDTIPLDDYNAFCYLGAAYASLTAASKMAGSTDSTIQSDVVNYRDGVSRWNAVSKYWRDRYEAHMGIAQDVPAQGMTKNWDSNFSWGQDRLTHRRQQR